MIAKRLLFVLPLLFVLNSFAQKIKDYGEYKPPVQKVFKFVAQKRTNVFIEAGGNGRGGSLNIEETFQSRDSNYHAIRIGAGVAFYIDSIGKTIPISYSRIFRRKKTLLEAGIGVTTTISKKETRSFYVAIIGFRRDIRKNFFYRVGFTPIVYYKFNKSSPTILPYVGASVGFHFRHK